MSDAQQAAYELNSISWGDLKAYGVGVAGRATLPRESRTQLIRREVVRECRTGFLGMKRVKVLEETSESTEVISDFWVLMSRYWNKEEKTQHTLDETNELTLYCLRSNGELFVRSESSETVSPFGGGRRTTTKDDPKERPFTEVDAYMFDFKPQHYETFGRNPKIWTNRDNTDELLVYGKGFGLSLALRKLL